MGIAQKLEVILPEQVACHAACLPIANTQTGELETVSDRDALVDDL